MISYAVALAQSSRPQNPDASQYVKDYVEWGAGPRASQYLILGAKARTILQGRYAVSVEDIQALAPSVLRHRIFPNFKAQGEGLSSLDIINRLLSDVKPSDDGKAATVNSAFQTRFQICHGIWNMSWKFFPLSRKSRCDANSYRFSVSNAQRKPPCRRQHSEFQHPWRSTQKPG